MIASIHINHTYIHMWTCGSLILRPINMHELTIYITVCAYACSLLFTLLVLFELQHLRSSNTWTAGKFPLASVWCNAVLPYWINIDYNYCTCYHSTPSLTLMSLILTISFNSCWERRPNVVMYPWRWSAVTCFWPTIPNQPSPIALRYFSYIK